MNKRDNEKKCVLYIGNEYRADSIRESLEKIYDVTLHNNLDNEVIDLILQPFNTRKFDAIITNMPPNSVSSSPALLALRRIFIESCYQDSLKVLKEIKKLMSIPIIIYTGAGNSPAVEIVFSEVGDWIVHKSEDPGDDSQKIHNALNTLLAKREKIAS
jgi:hypothetical protein